TGAVTLAAYYAYGQGYALTPDPSWSRRIIWGNEMLTGGVIDPRKNAWLPGVEWGYAKTQGDDGDNIVWGTSDDGDNIVWGTSGDDAVVWPELDITSIVEGN